jgi:hypothetical protein
MRAAPDGVPKQASTFGTTIQEIMETCEFEAGVADVRLGRPPRFDDPIAWGWNYERGRMFAVIAPMRMPLKVGKRKRTNLRALQILGRAMLREKSIL